MKSDQLSRSMFANFEDFLKEKVLVLQGEKRILESEKKRLLNILEDRSMKEGDMTFASDCYYHIADLIGVPDGGSVIGEVQALIKDRKSLIALVNLIADDDKDDDSEDHY